MVRRGRRELGSPISPCVRAESSVHRADGGLEVRIRLDDDDGRERLLHPQVALVVAAGDDRGVVHLAVPLAAGEHLAALGDRVVHPPLDAHGVALGDQRADEGVRLQWVPLLEQFRLLDQRAHDGVVVVLAHQQPLQVDARLPRLVEGAEADTIDDGGERLQEGGAEDVRQEVRWWRWWWR